MQDCSNSSTLAVELLQSCSEPLMYALHSALLPIEKHVESNAPFTHVIAWYIGKPFGICLLLRKFLSLAECVYLNLWTSLHELVKSKISLSPISDGFALYLWHLTHWGRVTHICVGDLTIIDSDNGLSPEWRQAINSNNAGILLIGPLRTNFSEISVQIHTFLSRKCIWKHLRNGSLFCHGLNVLTYGGQN